MAYEINARLDQGTPTLSLIDSKTGRDSFYWQGTKNNNGEHDWQSLFKNLMKFCCANQVFIGQLSKINEIENACLSCSECTKQTDQQTSELSIQYHHGNRTE